MIKLLGNVPNKVAIAVSGGPDSMAALNFLHNNGKREVLALHFNHNTGKYSVDAENLLVSYCSDKGIPLVVGHLSRERLKDESKEEFWRNERYSFFNDYLWPKCRKVNTHQIDYDSLTNFYYSNTPIITCHHLNDVVETWIFTSLHGNPMLIPYKRDSFIRPFLITTKDELLSWCANKGVPHLIDPSNDDTSYMRNFIRHILLPNALQVNPGIQKVIRKKIKEDFNKNMDII